MAGWNEGNRDLRRRARISRASLTYRDTHPHSPSHIQIILIYKLSDKLEFGKTWFELSGNPWYKYSRRKAHAIQIYHVH